MSFVKSVLIKVKTMTLVKFKNHLASAKYINGILTVNLPKRPEVTMKTKQITVQ
jgi:HSP20 family molecular chaperone IbpA